MPKFKPKETEPHSHCAGCNQRIPTKNLHQINPASRKKYCWSCCYEARRKLPTGSVRPKRERNTE